MAGTRLREYALHAWLCAAREELRGERLRSWGVWLLVMLEVLAALCLVQPAVLTHGAVVALPLVALLALAAVRMCKEPKLLVDMPLHLIWPSHFSRFGLARPQQSAHGFFVGSTLLRASCVALSFLALWSWNIKAPFPEVTSKWCLADVEPRFCILCWISWMRPGSRNVNSEEVTDLEEVSDGGVIYRGQDWCQRARLKKQQYSSAWWQVQDSHGFAKQKLTRFEACTTCFRRCACQSLLIPQKLQPSCSADGMERINAENMSVWEGWDSSWDGWFYKPGFDQRVMHYSGHGHAFSPMAFFDLQYFNVSWLETNIRLASFVQCVVMADIDETEFWEAFVRRWGVHVLLYLPPVSLALWGLLALALPMALGSSAWSMLGGAPADAQLVQAIEARADALRRQIVQKQTHPSRKDVAMLYMNFVLFCADLVSDWVVLVEFALAGEVGLAGAQTAIIVGPLLLDCYRGKIQVVEVLSGFNKARRKGFPGNAYMKALWSEKSVEAPLSMALQWYGFLRVTDARSRWSMLASMALSVYSMTSFCFQMFELGLYDMATGARPDDPDQPDEPAPNRLPAPLESVILAAPEGLQRPMPLEPPPGLPPPGIRQPTHPTPLAPPPGLFSSPKKVGKQAMDTE
ncbi:unnamed protein product [Symbiodinium microadriaticum]|nr:unnamed protein product [Symbiodinium microadriaticum]